MQEFHVRVARSLHHLRGHLIGLEQLDALGPYIVRLAHGHPYVRIEEVAILHGLFHIFGNGNLGTSLGGYLTALGDEFIRRSAALGACGTEIDTHLGAADHQRVAHVVARIAQVAELHLLERLVGVLLHGEQVGKYLRGVELGRQPVPNHDAGVFSEVFHDILTVSAVFDTVVHTAEHTGRICDALLLAHLGTRRAEVGHLRPLVVCSHLEGAARTRGILFKKEDDVLAFEHLFLPARLLVRFQACGKLYEPVYLFGSEIEQFQKISSFDIHCSIFF